MSTGQGEWAQRHPKLMRAMQLILLVMIGLLVITECAPDDGTTAQKAKTQTVAPRPVEPELSADQTVLFRDLLAVWNRNDLCVDRVTAAREEFGDGSVGAKVLDGYDKLKAAISACDSAGRDAAEFQISELSEPPKSGLVREALDACRVVAPNAAQALRGAVRWLDEGSGALAEASKVRADLERIAGDHGMCGSALANLAESYGIPAAETRLFHQG